MIWRENLKLSDRCKHCSRSMLEHTYMSLDEIEAYASTGRMLKHVCDIVGNLEGDIDLMLLCITISKEIEDPCDNDHLKDISNE